MRWPQLKGDWHVGQRSPTALFRHVLVSDTPGATLMLRFKGAASASSMSSAPTPGDLEFSIDGGAWQPCPNFDQGCLNGFAPAAGFSPGALIRTAGTSSSCGATRQPEGNKGRFVRIGCLLVDGDVPDPYAGKTPLERLDAIYAAMEPLRYTRLRSRWRRIPRTMQRLREGGSLKVVLLGDSIMGQTCGLVLTCC